MFLLCVFTSIVLRALTGQAKVVENFNECREYFYKGQEPAGMDQNAKKICQSFGHGDFYYATLYSVHHRIPLYSAYTLDPECSNNPGRANSPWHIEPQLSNSNQPESMVLESESDKNIIKKNQAISSDYAETGYDRGHLNPNSFQCSDGRDATFTLTNVAPMDACFNRIYWKNSESNLRTLLKDQLKMDEDQDQDQDQATVYIVTGTVPDQNSRIPVESQRVTVPSHIWTAVCYEHSFDNAKSFSFGYIGRNQPETIIRPVSVSQLNTELSQLYSSSVSIQIFVGDCFTGNARSKQAVKTFLNKLPENQRHKMPSDVQNTYLAVKRVIDSDSGGPSAKYRVTGMTATLGIDSFQTFSTVVEEMKNVESACLITTAKNSKSIFSEDLKKRDVLEQSDSVECQVVPEKSVAGWQTAADGSQCQSVLVSSDKCSCTTESDTKLCCSSPCLYQQDRKSYWCYSGQRLIQCSPQYSLITYKGERCKDNHPCATYGYDYYWCRKISGSWDYCSPPLWQSKAKDGKYCRDNHACAKYGQSEPWCYTDDDKKKPCCTSDDCFSAVKVKTCNSDHPCGYHDYGYLWCHTTDGSWDYCCKNCSY
ncbi:hypothetical protein PGIGA_G00011820 [Pangasianodon gigas]|uniref:Uncharacterized protein n=1 Tax=Pangasianodon gigas TaxID=30993 RepID=A0ACC5W748_PANGG|nr:hypothetical protein [Pangasianodon gigas]